MDKGSEIIDKSKLTQRELLLLLSDQVEGLKENMKEFKAVVPTLQDRVTRIETKMIVTAAAFGVGSIILTIIINIFGIFK